MTAISLALFIVGTLLLVEGIIIALFPIWTKQVMKKAISKVETIRNVGVSELIIALILLALAFRLS